MKTTQRAMVILLSILSVSSFTAMADENIPEGAKALLASIKKNLPQIPIEGVFDTPMAGLYGVELAGGQIIYGSADGGYIISGDMYQLGDEVVNLAETRRAVHRKEVMDQVPVEDMIVFSPTGDRRSYVNVFTDVDCGYCRKLHLEMADLNALGIEVRYLAYPRAGIGTPTYDKIVSAWCAENPNEAITELKAGRTIPTKSCDHPVGKQYEVGQKVGVTGTPAIITASGRLLPGYMPAKDLAAAIGLE